jgi:hypothetical protein
MFFITTSIGYPNNTGKSKKNSTHHRLPDDTEKASKRQVM